jgi:uncharacterized coiled-coil DUF342 family protein
MAFTTGVAEVDKIFESLRAIVQEVERLRKQNDEFRQRIEMRERQISEAHEDIFAPVKECTKPPSLNYR